MAVVVEVEHAGQEHAGFHREDVAVSAAPHVEEILHAPVPRRPAVEVSALGGARAAVDHVVIGHHDDLVRGREAVDAQGVELALGAHHHPVVDHDEVRHGVEDLARLHRGPAACPGEYLFNSRHSHVECSES
jgi:hypothetical protein